MNKGLLNAMVKELIAGDKMLSMPIVKVEMRLATDGMNISIGENPITKITFETCSKEENDWYKETVEQLEELALERSKKYQEIVNKNDKINEEVAVPEKLTSLFEFDEEKCKGCPAYDECKSNK